MAQLKCSPLSRPHPLGSQGLLGLAIDRFGNLYAALASFNPDTHGVYRIGPDGTDIERLTGSENIAFPNALTFDIYGRLYVSDSTGAIWRYVDGTFGNDPWTQDPLLEPLPNDPFGFPLPGANGIGFYPPNCTIRREHGAEHAFANRHRLGWQRWGSYAGDGTVLASHCGRNCG